MSSTGSLGSSTSGSSVTASEAETWIRDTSHDEAENWISDASHDKEEKGTYHSRSSQRPLEDGAGGSRIIGAHSNIRKNRDSSERDSRIVQDDGMKLREKYCRYSIGLNACDI
jgi:hypothetical protein